MKAKVFPLLPMLALFVLLVVPAVAWADGDDGPNGRAAPRMDEAEQGDHGGGDPDNPVPCDGGSDESVSTESKTAAYIGEEIDDSFGWLVEAAKGYLGSLTLF